MVKKNTICGKLTICITILSHHPKTILFCNSVRTEWMERSILILRYFLHLSIQFRRRSLINAGLLIKSKLMNRIQNTKDTKCIHIPCINRHIKRISYM